MGMKEREQGRDYDRERKERRGTRGRAGQQVGKKNPPPLAFSSFLFVAALPCISPCIQECFKIFWTSRKEGDLFSMSLGDPSINQYKGKMGGPGRYVVRILEIPTTTGRMMMNNQV